MELRILRASLAFAILLSSTVAAGLPGAFAQTGRATISGYITDAKTGETLISAGVSTGSGAALTGVVTNPYGFYTLTLGKGRHELTFSYMGYSDRTLPLDLQRDTTINIALNGAALDNNGGSSLKIATITATIHIAADSDFIVSISNNGKGEKHYYEGYAFLPCA